MTIFDYILCLEHDSLLYIIWLDNQFASVWGNKILKKLSIFFLELNSQTKEALEHITAQQRERPDFGGKHTILNI